VSNDGSEFGFASVFDIKVKFTGASAQGVVYGDDKPPSIGLPGVLEKSIEKAVFKAVIQVIQVIL